MNKNRTFDLYLDHENGIAIGLINGKRSIVSHIPDGISFDLMTIDSLSDVVNTMFPDIFTFDPLDMHIYQTGRTSRDLIIGTIDGRLVIETKETAVSFVNYKN